METSTRNLVVALRRSWVWPVAISLAMPAGLAIEALEILDPPWAETANLFLLAGAGVSILTLAGEALLSSLRAQPRRRGQTTFERIQTLAQPARSVFDFAGEPSVSTSLPKWMSWVGKRVSKPASLIERGAAVTVLIAVIVLLNAPDHWVTTSLGSFVMDHGNRLTMVFTLIGILALASFRLACQALVFVRREPPRHHVLEA